MSDPFRKVQSGDSLFPISAVTWNGMIEAAQAEQRRKAIGAGVLDQTRSATIVRVKNESGSNLDRNTILGLHGPLFTPTDSQDAFLRGVTFRGIVPTDTDHKRRYVVMLDPCLDGYFGRAYLAGVCQVKVNVLDTAHQYAIIDTGRTDRLKSSFHGHARILWREGDEGYGYGYETGVQWAIVMLGVTGSSGAIGRAAGDISARSGTTYGTGNVDLYRSDGGHSDGPIERVAVLNASQDTMSSGAGIDDGLYVAVEWDADDTAWVSPLECGSGGGYYGY